MRTLRSALAGGIVIACSLHPGSAFAKATAPTDPKLHDELVAMMKVDQEARQAMIDSGFEHPDPKTAARMHAVDKTNTARIKEIIRDHGWPGLSLVGQDGEQAAFLMVQHADADPAFQKRVLPLLEAAYKSGEAPGEHMALLTDRVLTAEGKPQRYGTQAQIINGKIVLKPVEDEANLDKRRAQVGLGPIAEYIETLRKVYKLP